MKEFTKIKNEELSRGVASLPLRPNQTSQFGQSALSGKELQKKFDYLAKDVIAKKFNDLISILSSTDVLSYFKITDTETLAAFVKTLEGNLIEGQLSATDPAAKDKKTVDTILSTLYSAIEAVKTFTGYAEGEATIADIYATIEELEQANTAISEETSARQTAVSNLETKLEGKIEVEKTAAISAADAIADSKIGAHNSSETAHDDIRGVISKLQAVIEDFFAEDADNDANLDRLVEIVTLINSNADAIDTIATNKVSKTDIVDNLTSNAKDKPLSAAQGAGLKALIDALKTVIDSKLPSANVDTEALTDNNAHVPSSALVKSLLDNFKGGGGLDLPADAMSVFTEAFLTNGTHGLLYHLYDDYAVCAGIGDSTETSIEIGSLVKGLPVTNIKKTAFYDTRITSVTIPNSVTNISEYAFALSDVQNVCLPNSISRVENGTFMGCTLLANINIPDGVIYIGNNAFQNCDALTSIILPDGLQEIGESAFVYCDGIQSMIIPSSVTSIGKHAFAECTSLTDIYYRGTEAQWNAITFGEEWNYETNATIHYNYGG